MKTLKDFLLTQDMSEKCADKICEAVLRDNFDANSDPISAIIINAFNANLYGKLPKSEDYDSFETDLNYAINQLQRVKKYLTQTELEDAEFKMFGL